METKTRWNVRFWSRLHCGLRTGGADGTVVICCSFTLITSRWHRHITNHIQPSISYLPQYSSSPLESALKSLQWRVQTTDYRVQSTRTVWGLDMVFTSPDQKITVEPPHLSNKTGKPGWWLLQVLVAVGGVGGLAPVLTRPCENVPNISQSSRWRGDSECNALSCYNDHNTTTTTTTITSHL